MSMFFYMQMHFILTISFFLITDCINFPSDRPPPEHDQLVGKSPVGDPQGLDNAMISSL